MHELFSDADVISVYTRAQAIDDGVLTPTTALVPDEPDFAQQAGWKIPVAVTASVVGLVIPNEAEEALGQDRKGRLWDVLFMGAVWARRNRDTDVFHYPVAFQMRRPDYRGNRPVTVTLEARVGPGDEAEPVLTIMLPGED